VGDEDEEFSGGRQQPEGPRKISNGGDGRYEEEPPNVVVVQQSNKLSPFLETSTKRNSSLELKGDDFCMFCLSDYLIW
jgi:hypothetical protein